MKRTTLVLLSLMASCLDSGLAAGEEGHAALNCLHAAARQGGLQACAGGGSMAPVLVSGAERQEWPEAAKPEGITPAETRAAEPPSPGPSTRQGGDFKTGLVNGAWAGFAWPFYAVLSPAIHLLSEGFGRRMSRAYDGARGDNGGSGAYTAGGVVLGAVLYVPALAVGAAGAVIGAVAGPIAEKLRPGSTSRWDPDKI